MAVSINTSGTYTASRVDSADTATGWSVVKLEGAGGGPSLLASVGTIDLVAEGTDARAARTNKQRVQILFTNAAGYDFTSGSTGTGTNKVPSGIAYVWALFLAAGSLFTKANGGMQISLGDGTNTSYWNVAGSDDYSGGFKKWAAYTGAAESENTGTAADLGDITEIGFVTDVGGTTTRFDNFVVDAIDVGDGLTIQGTTTGDALFGESLTQDEATAIGILSQENGKFFAQGSLEFSGTAQTSDAESLTFIDTLGGAYTYNLDITGTVTFTNTSVDADGAVDYNFDSSGATAFTMTGGGLADYLTLTTASGQTMSGAVFANGGTATIANTVDTSTFNLCGKITATGALDSCTINKSTASEAVTSSTTTNITDCTFVKDTANSHALELTGAASTYSWNNTLTGYDAGTTGNGVQTVVGSTATGNEAILITAASGTFNISVADGASVPSVAVASGSTAVVNVTANQITIEVTVLDDDTGSAIGTTSRVHLVRSSDKSVLISGACDVSGYISTQIDFDSITNIEGWARDMDLSGDDYVPADIGGQYTESGFSTTVRLKKQG